MRHVGMAAVTGVLIVAVGTGYIEILPLQRRGTFACAAIEQGRCILSPSSFRHEESDMQLAICAERSISLRWFQLEIFTLLTRYK
jgi:hypothetical protein